MEAKIALEEHFSTALNNRLWDAKGEMGRNGPAYSQDIEARLIDPDRFLADMDWYGAQRAILSLTSPGVQGVADRNAAVELARGSNDHLARVIGEHPDRFSGFAAVSLQEPREAADELERCVRGLGFKGALVNGYTNVGPGESVQYLDEEPVGQFWEQAANLGVPVYLHPREPLPSQRRAYHGYPELIGSAWGFGWETASHAVRLMLSGLFDRHPTLQVILGHLGDGLPFLAPRLQHRLDEQRDGERGSKARRRMDHYLRANFHYTTSGRFHTQQLMDMIATVGADRVLFSCDYPYEQLKDAAQWFDELTLDAGLKYQLGRGNALKLLKLDS
jgi:gamma-resorcylate decarboxylase